MLKTGVNNSDLRIQRWSRIREDRNLRLGPQNLCRRMMVPELKGGRKHPSLKAVHETRINAIIVPSCMKG